MADEKVDLRDLEVPSLQTDERTKLIVVREADSYAAPNRPATADDIARALAKCDPEVQRAVLEAAGIHQDRYVAVSDVKAGHLVKLATDREAALAAKLQEAEHRLAEAEEKINRVRVQILNAVNDINKLMSAIGSV